MRSPYLNKLFLIIMVCSVTLSFGQTSLTYEGKKINAVDAANMKQGRWIYFGKMKKLPKYGPEQKVEEGDFQDNRKTGVWTTYFPSESIKSEITFKSNRPEGLYKVYYENGQLEEEGNWRNNRNTGTFKRFYEDGKPHQEFTFNATGKREGTQKYYHENGQLMIEGNWAGGKEAGELTEYYANGEVRSKKYFNDGQIDAAKTTSFEPKQQIVKVPDPAPPAPQPEERKVRTEVVTKASKPNIGYFDGNGQRTLYNRNKQISQKGMFKNGKLIDGKWYRYNSDGILTNIEIYKNGAYIGDGVIEDQK